MSASVAPALCMSAISAALNPDGTCPSTKLNVPFLRDTQGRITQITFTDPVSQRRDVYSYSYDSDGTLQRVSYPLLDTSGNPIHADYTYDTTHLYTGGTDPLGHAFGNAGNRFRIRISDFGFRISTSWLCTSISTTPAGAPKLPSI